MNIYNMKLFELLVEDQLKIQRVPGGWLFTQKHHYIKDTINGPQNNTSWGTTVFVPFDNEFQEIRKEDAMSNVFPIKYFRTR